MASYAAPNNIPQLPSYQGTIPIDMMLQVGMAKEAEYNSKHQVIQDSIDKLGQFPIVKEADKALISSKMNDLVSQLNQYSGQDTSDSRVYNKLTNLTSSLANDSDVFKSISSNQAAVAEDKRVKDITEDDPNLFGASNMQLYNQAKQAWHNAPAGTPFKAQYTPYYDPSKEIGTIVDRVKADPDIVNGNAMNPDGSLRPYTQQEIEEVTAKKLKMALQSTLSDKAQGQMQIDYQAGLSSPQYGLHSTLLELNGHVREYDSIINNLKTALPNVKSQQARDKTQELIDQTQAQKDAHQDMMDRVAQTGDPTLYHSYGKYVDDQLQGMANSYAYRQEGKVGYDELFMEKTKEAARANLARHKALLQHDLSTEPGAVNTFQEGYKDFAIKGEAELAPQHVYAMQNFVGKIQNDGSVDASIGNKEQALDLQATLDANHMRVPVTKALGYGPMMTGYNDWTKTPLGHNESKNIYGEDSPIYPGSGQQISTSVKTPKSFDEYIKYMSSTKGKTGTLIDDFVNKFGWNPTNSVDLANARKLATDPKIMATIEAASTIMTQNKIRGTVNLVPQDGTNTVAGSDGRPYNKFFAQMNRADLNNIYGNSWWITPDKGAQLLDDNNTIHNTNTYRKDNNGKDITDKGYLYQVPIILASTRPIGEVSADIINHDHIMAQHPGPYNESMNNTLSLVNYTKRYAENDIDALNAPPQTLQELALSKINGLVTAGHLDKAYAQDYINRVNRASYNIINGNSDSQLKNRALLKGIITATGDKPAEQLLSNLRNIGRLSAPLTVTTKPTNNAYQDTEE